MPVWSQIPAPPSNALELGPLTVRWYGLAIAIGVLSAITILRRRYAAVGGNPDVADKVALIAVGVGFLGARLAYVSTNLERYLPIGQNDAWRPVDLLRIFAVWEGGLALYGGLTFGTITAWFLVRRYGGSRPAFMDAAAPGIPIAQAFGRLGNYFNQELYGTPTDLPWGLQVDEFARRADYAAFSTFHPTFLYEGLWNLGLAALIIWLGRRGRLAQGSLLFVYAIGYGTVRFLLELIRTDTTFRVLGLSRNGWFSVLVVVVGTAGLIWWQRRGGAAEAAKTGLLPPDRAIVGAAPADDTDGTDGTDGTADRDDAETPRWRDTE